MKRGIKLKNRIEKDEEGRFVVQVPFSYEMYGTVELKFDSLEEMYKKLSSPSFVDELSVPDNGCYVGNTLEVDIDALEVDVDAYQEENGLPYICETFVVLGITDC